MKSDFILISSFCVFFFFECFNHQILTLNQKHFVLFRRKNTQKSVILKVIFASNERLIHYATLNLGVFMCIYINLLLNLMFLFNIENNRKQKRRP